MPSGRRAKSRARLVLRIDSGSARRSSPSAASRSNAYSYTSSSFRCECRALKSEMPSTPSTTASLSITNCVRRLFSADSTIQANAENGR